MLDFTWQHIIVRYQGNSVPCVSLKLKLVKVKSTNITKIRVASFIVFKNMTNIIILSLLKYNDSYQILEYDKF